MDELTKYRVTIDTIDKKLIELLFERKRTIQLISKIKKDLHKAPLDPTRWNELLKTRLEWARELDLEVDFISNVFEDIHDWSLLIQSKS
jgi:chorismate mutase